MKFEPRPFFGLRLQSETFTNPRQRSGLAPDEIRELALHIGRHGLRVPLTITSDGTITAGQRRYLAIEMLIAWYQGDSSLLQVEEKETSVFEWHAMSLRDDVPCMVEDPQQTQETILELAVADNLTRAEMSTYDVAEQIAALVARGRTLTAIADGIGRDRTSVSKMAKAWRGACPELKAAWASEQVTYSQVQELADLSPAAQRMALATPQPEEGRKPRGPHGRPGIEVLKEILARYAAALATWSIHGPNLTVPSTFTAEAYLRGFVHALKIATGEAPLESVAEISQVAP